MLAAAANDECKESLSLLEADLPHVKSLLLEIAKAGKYDFPLSVEGNKPTETNRDEKNLSLLERADLAKGETKYTHRNVYRQYVLTQRGTELVAKLKSEA